MEKLQITLFFGYCWKDYDYPAMREFEQFSLVDYCVYGYFPVNSQISVYAFIKDSQRFGWGSLDLSEFPEVPQEWVEQLEGWCRILGITPPQIKPCWHVVSSFGD